VMNIHRSSFSLWQFSLFRLRVTMGGRLWLVNSFTKGSCCWWDCGKAIQWHWPWRGGCRTVLQRSVSDEQSRSRNFRPNRLSSAQANSFCNRLHLIVLGLGSGSLSQQGDRGLVMVTAGHIDDDHRVRRLEKTMILVQIVMVHLQIL